MTKLDLQKGISYFFRTRSNPEIRSGILKCLSEDGCYAILTRSENVTEKVPIPWLFETREGLEKEMRK